MDGAFAEESAGTRRDRGAAVVRTFPSRNTSAASGAFDPLALFPAESAPAAGPAALVASPNASAQRPSSATTWLICGVVIGAAAAVAAPRVRIPVGLLRAPSPPVASVETRPPATPLTIDAGHHDQTPAATPPHVTHPLTVPAASAVAPPAPAFGWLAISSPFTVRVLDGASAVGASGSKVRLPAGRHEVRLVSDALGYDERRAVNIRPGKLSSVSVDAPKSTIDINALPWADVSIDGESIGQTPLAHIPVTIGTHVVRFRHPQLGEQRRTVTVTSKGPNRVSADLSTR